VTQILGPAGDGRHPLRGPVGIALDAAGNLYVAGHASNNVFRVSRAGRIEQLMDGGGDGSARLVGAMDVAVDPRGNLYVLGQLSRNVFRRTPDGEIRQILDASGGATGHKVIHPNHLDVDARGNVYVAARNAVYRIDPDGHASILLNESGDRKGHALLRPNAIYATPDGTVYVVGARSDNAFRRTPDGAVTQIADATGAGGGRKLWFPNGIAADGAGNAYIAGNNSGNILRVTPEGQVTEVVGPRFEGRLLGACSDVTVRADGHVFFTRLGSRAAWWLTPAGKLTELIDVNGAGSEQLLKAARSIAADAGGNVYVSGLGSHNVLRVQLDTLEAAAGTAEAAQ
jgi:sugar lactone lactonase YvrE